VFVEFVFDWCFDWCLFSGAEARARQRHRVQKEIKNKFTIFFLSGVYSVLQKQEPDKVIYLDGCSLSCAQVATGLGIGD